MIIEMRIALVSWTGPPDTTGELERHLANLIIQFQLGGHDVHLLCGTVPGRAPSKSRWRGATIVRTSELSPMASNWVDTAEGSNRINVEQYVDLFRREFGGLRPDVIHAFDLQEVNPDAAFALHELAQAPLFHTPFTRFGGASVLQLPWVKQFAKDDHDESWMKKAGTKSPISVVPPGVDLEQFRPHRARRKSRELTAHIFGDDVPSRWILAPDDLDGTHDHVHYIRIASQVSRSNGSTVPLVFVNPRRLANPERGTTRVRQAIELARSLDVDLRITTLTTSMLDTAFSAAPLVMFGRHGYSPGLMPIEAMAVGAQLVYTNKPVNGVGHERREVEEVAEEALALLNHGQTLDDRLGGFMEASNHDVVDSANRILEELAADVLPRQRRAIPAKLKHLAEQPGHFRKLAIDVPDSALRADPHAKIDLVIIPTIGPDSVLGPAMEIARTNNADVLVPCSSKDDAFSMALTWEGMSPNDVSFGDITSFGEDPSNRLATSAHPISSISTRDRAAKVSLGLMVAAMTRKNRVLIIDDDVFELRQEYLATAAAYVGPGKDQLTAVTIPVIEFADHGVPNHVAEWCGVESPVFGSGGALVAWAPDLPPFADIYNEDLLQWLELIRQGRLGIIGSARQLVSWPLHEAGKATQQEWGDSIAMGLLDGFVQRHREGRRGVAFPWHRVPAEFFEKTNDQRLFALSQLIRQVDEFAAGANLSRANFKLAYGSLIPELYEAIRRNLALDAELARSLVSDYHHDHPRWKRALRQLPRADSVPEALDQLGVRFHSSKKGARHHQPLTTVSASDSVSRILDDRLMWHPGGRGQRLIEEVASALGFSDLRRRIDRSHVTDPEFWGPLIAANASRGLAAFRLSHAPAIDSIDERAARRFAFPLSIVVSFRSQSGPYLRECMDTIDRLPCVDEKKQALRKAAEQSVMCSHAQWLGNRRFDVETMANDRRTETTDSTKTVLSALLSRHGDLPSLLDAEYAASRTFELMHHALHSLWPGRPYRHSESFTTSFEDGCAVALFRLVTSTSFVPGNASLDWQRKYRERVLTAIVDRDWRDVIVDIADDSRRGLVPDGLPIRFLVPQISHYFERRERPNVGNQLA